MNIKQGKVLLDNTTIYGAKYAYNAWPPAVTDWFEDPNALNLRSLMDILEAIVLYDKIIVDASSRMVPGERNETEPVWHDLMELQDRWHNSVFFDVPFAGIKKGQFVVSAVKLSFAKLLKHLKSGTFTEAARKFAQNDVDFVIPEFYRNPEDFGRLFSKGFHTESLPEDILELLVQVEDSLRMASAQDSNYAMFAYRGFYYQELSRLFSISYSPHTWRSNLIDIDTEKPFTNFVEYIRQVTGQVRQELADRLNSEFGNTSFSCEFPVISTFIAHQCNTREELLEVALQVRESSSVRAFRQWVSDIQFRIRTQSDLPEVVKAKSELEFTIKNIRKQLGLLDEKRTEQVKIKLEIPMASLEVPIKIPFGLPTWLEDTFKWRSHLVFLREITKKSVSLSPFAYRYAQLKP
jgi:hypothetical protein